MSVGTTPESIQVVATVAMQIRIGTAGRICMALRRSPVIRLRRVAIPPMALRPSERAAAVSSIHGPSSETASAPRAMITEMRVTSRKARGMSEIVTAGERRRPKIFDLFNSTDGL